MKQLIEDYKRRLDTINQMIENFKSNGSINDIRKDERLKTKAAEFRTFIAELEKASNSFIENIIQDIDSKQQSGIQTSNEEWFSDEQFDVLRQFAKNK